mmetsp:Transcript_25611/g.60928  ORF Transcript_25611/g.60928 Transcript_25611/m.60928 type:complete len:315 (-) Transcript_25611:411-1355(-)
MSLFQHQLRLAVLPIPSPDRVRGLQHGEECGRLLRCIRVLRSIHRQVRVKVCQELHCRHGRRVLRQGGLGDLDGIVVRAERLLGPEAGVEPPQVVVGRGVVRRQEHSLGHDAGGLLGAKGRRVPAEGAAVLHHHHPLVPRAVVVDIPPDELQCEGVLLVPEPMRPDDRLPMAPGVVVLCIVFEHRSSELELRLPGIRADGQGALAPVVPQLVVLRVAGGDVLHELHLPLEGIGVAVLDELAEALPPQVPRRVVGGVDVDERLREVQDSLRSLAARLDGTQQPEHVGVLCREAGGGHGDSVEQRQRLDSRPLAAL